LPNADRRRRSAAHDRAEPSGREPSRSDRTAGRDHDEAEEGAGPQRLQKVLAAAGVGSRRKSEELIAAGRVTVDGRRATLGDRVDPQRAVIVVDGERIVTDTRLVYLALHKPRGVVSTMSDERGRAGIAELLGQGPNALAARPALAQRVYHVGRLDTDSEGLLLLTNDGELAHRLTHPSYGVPKTYLAEVPGPLPRSVGRALRAGVDLDDGPARVDAFRLVDATPRTALVEITLHEGRKHIVRRMLDHLGHPVNRLIRVKLGPVSLGDLKPGRWRHLTRPEVAALFAAAEKAPAGERSPTGEEHDDGAEA
jgi:23S rRNA pseudouridine2605 synthase